jgi:thioredoxin-like negative regulator of GroEL
MMPVTQEHHLNIRVAGKTYRLDYRQAFRVGYTLLRTRRFRDAAQVFDGLSQLSNNDHTSITIMLAYCKAGLRDYVGSSSVLGTLFSEDQGDRADQLHTAFACLSVGMWADATEELTGLVEQCPHLPTLSLLLGDLFLVQKQPDKAIVSWEKAIERDRDGGAVTAVARQLIATQARAVRKA